MDQVSPEDMKHKKWINNNNEKNPEKPQLGDSR